MYVEFCALGINAFKEFRPISTVQDQEITSRIGSAEILLLFVVSFTGWIR